VVRALGHLALTAALAAATGGCRRPAEPAPSTPTEPAREGAERYGASLAEGDAAFQRRGDPARLEAAIAAYARAAAQRPGIPEAELRLSRAEAFRALLPAAPAVTRQAWEASARAAERALRTISPAWAAGIDAGEDPAAAAARVDGSGAEALYLLAQGSMRAAQATGHAAVLSVKDATLAMMARAAELDERVDAAGPHRALGAWRAALPVAAGGGAAASRAHFDRARALAPDELLARVSEAESYAVLVQDSALFDRLLDEVARADLSRDPDRAAENAIARRRAEALRARKARLF
jgi:hypothetical protein